MIKWGLFNLFQMNKTDKCVTIKMEQVLSVSAQPATIFVYDYYDKRKLILFFVGWGSL